MIKFWIVTIIVQSQKFDPSALRIIEQTELNSSSSSQIITCILIDYVGNFRLRALLYIAKLFSWPEIQDICTEHVRTLKNKMAETLL
jgi:hypothetical protein